MKKLIIIILTFSALSSIKVTAQCRINATIDSLGHKTYLTSVNANNNAADQAQMHLTTKAAPETLDTFWVNKQEIHVPARIQHRKKTEAVPGNSSNNETITTPAERKAGEQAK